MDKMKRMINSIIQYSCNIVREDVVYINFFGEKNRFLDYLLKELDNMGVPYILRVMSNELLDELLKDISIEKTIKTASEEVDLIKQSTVYISLIAEEIKVSDNLINEYIIYQKYYKREVRDARLKYCRWLGLRLPTKEMADLVGMSFQEFENLYYKACSIDYARLETKSFNLARALEQAKKVRIITDSTDIVFDKNGIPTRILCGKINLPDGEIYTSPKKYSLKGVVKFNTTSLQAGYKFEDIKLVFRNGKIIEASCNNTDKLINILDSDDGSRYIGEFAIGINENIEEPIGIILFDEKIRGTIHFAIGQSYEDAYNGNDSSVHWDLVLNMNKDAGGGKILFDDKLVFKDGDWLI